MSKVEQVLDDILTSVPPTEEELEIAKSSAANSFVFNFASKPQQLSRLLVYYVLGLPEVFQICYDVFHASIALPSLNACHCIAQNRGIPKTVIMLLVSLEYAHYSHWEVLHSWVL